MVWDEKFEMMHRDELIKVQLERVKKTVKRACDKVPFYKEKFKEAGITAEDIKSLDDLAKIPFTTKDDLRAHYPFGLFTVPLSDVVRIHASSGTTGQVTVVGYTMEDINTWAELMARTLVCCETNKEDVVHNAYGYGLFTGGLGIHYGAERIGATVIPMSGGNSKRQIRVMVDFGSTILTCTPSYALHLAEVAEDMGIDFKTLKLKAGAFGAEPWSESMRKEIESKLNLNAYDIYGLSEVIGPGVSSECTAKNGLHIFEDHFLPEIIDPQSGKKLNPGEKGELVFTTLTKEAIPVIRYRTKDITSLNYDKCECGRTLVRMERVSGRSDDMLIIRGVNVFPSQIEQILMEIEGTEPHYQIIIEREGALDQVRIEVEVSEELLSDEIKRLEGLKKMIKEEIAGNLGISVDVKLAQPRTIARSEGKAKRVFDKRTI